MLDAVGVPVSQVKTITQLVDDPHLSHRDMLVEIDHPVVGAVRYPGNPLKLSATPPRVYRRAPLLGEHSAEILKERLGYSDSDIAQLKDNGVI